MTEYIEREAVLGEIDDWYDMYPENGEAREALKFAKRSVKKLPTVDAVPWMWLYERAIKISNIHVSNFLYDAINSWKKLQKEDGDG